MDNFYQLDAVITRY